MSNSPSTSSDPNDRELEPWEITLAERMVYGFLAEHGPFRTLDAEDLIHECLSHWWLQRGKYSPERGASKKTFMRRVLQKKLIDIERHEQAQKRKAERQAESLSKPIGDPEDDDDLTLEDVVASQEPEWAPQEMLDRSTLKERIDEVVPLLTDRQQGLVELLRSGANVTEASRILGIPRGTLYDEIKRIRELFRTRPRGVLEVNPTLSGGFSYMGSRRLRNGQAASFWLQGRHRP